MQTLTHYMYSVWKNPNVKVLLLTVSHLDKQSHHILAFVSCPHNKGPHTCSVQFSLFSPLTQWVFGGHKGRFCRDPLPAFSVGGPWQQFWHGQGCPLFGVVHPAFPLLTMRSPALHGALMNGFGKAVAAMTGWHELLAKTWGTVTASFTGLPDLSIDQNLIIFKHTCLIQISK